MNERMDTMKVKEIEKILEGTFEDENDRRYWEMKLAEEKQKERTAANNEIYFRKMAKYNR